MSNRLELEELSERVDAALSAEVREKLGPNGLAAIKELVFLHRQGVVDAVTEDGEWNFYVAEQPWTSNGSRTCPGEFPNGC
ncbi:hypothetical protein [Nocardia sp. CY41]|uniref:hypothetical protein n=1 Tax=Nocardia sp. CY41 TaxID=2608686 RepID=UPI00135BEDB2|nr:hypothetical protein [Nocardia sp. CY41]